MVAVRTRLPVGEVWVGSLPGCWSDREQGYHQYWSGYLFGKEQASHQCWSACRILYHMDPVGSNLAVCEGDLSGHREARVLLCIRPLHCMYPSEDHMGRSELADGHGCNDRDHRMSPCYGYNNRHHRMRPCQSKNNRALGRDSDMVESRSYQSGCDIQGQGYYDHHCHMAQESHGSEEWPSVMER